MFGSPSGVPLFAFSHCGAESLANDAISSIAAARSSAPRACSLAAAAASAAALPASSETEATCCAPRAASFIEPRMESALARICSLLETTSAMSASTRSRLASTAVVFWFSTSAADTICSISERTAVI